MKKILFLAVLVMMLALGLSAIASVKLATVINPVTGQKKVVEVGDIHAFDNGFVLMGQNIGIVTKAPESHFKRIVTGGPTLNASTTMTSAFSLTAAQVCNNAIITVNSAAVAGTKSAASLDITLPATSTMFKDCLSSEGDSISFLLLNQSPTAATSTQIVAGTGTDLRIPETTGADVEINGGSFARITLTRNKDSMGDGGSVDMIATVE